MKMQSSHNGANSDDPFDLGRFVAAQENSYDCALTEIRNGQKRTHWMWYIYPQIHGLGHSSTSQRYGITSADEADAYLSHPVLGPRLVTMCEAALEVEGPSATEIFGRPDDMKLRSCATLFEYVSGEDSVFKRLLLKYFSGKRDSMTLQLLDDA
ncbi:MAG: DUF1810 domain-containing protein, partial [Pirellulaceae bacterium]